MDPVSKIRPLGNGLLLIPCYNEEQSLPLLVENIRQTDVQMELLVINDGSTDRTTETARTLGVPVLDLPCNLGVGHAFQAGMRYALEKGFDYVVRIDGDGQHPPEEIAELIACAERVEADLVIGSRFGKSKTIVSTRFRYCGVWVLSKLLSRICRCEVKDPTSGFWLVRKELLGYFAVEFPTDYPEPEALALMRRQGYSFVNCPVRFLPRVTGVSSIRTWGTVYFMFKVGLALLVDRMRPVNRQYAKGYST